MFRLNRVVSGRGEEREERRWERERKEVRNREEIGERERGERADRR